MLIIGLTGSISTGKSTCSKILSSPPYNLPIIDADLLARLAVSPGTPAYRAIVKYFLPTTPDLLLSDPSSSPFPNGPPINRPALGARVFGTTPDKIKDRAVLNSIVHPAVRSAMYRAILRHWIMGNWAVILDVPLLFESGLDLLCGAVIMVAIGDEEVQISRLLTRDQGTGLSREDAEKRVRSQMSVAEKCERVEGYWTNKTESWLCKRVGKWSKRSHGGYVVWNDGSKEELGEQLHNVVIELRRGRDGLLSRWGGVAVWPVYTVLRAMWIVVGNWWRRKRWLEMREIMRRNEKKEETGQRNEAVVKSKI